MHQGEPARASTSATTGPRQEKAHEKEKTRKASGGERKVRSYTELRARVEKLERLLAESGTGTGRVAA